MRDLCQRPILVNSGFEAADMAAGVGVVQTPTTGKMTHTNTDTDAAVAIQ